MLNPHS